MPSKSIVALACILAVLSVTECFAEETEAQLHVQVEVTRSQMVKRIADQRKEIKTLTMAQKESKAKLAAIKAIFPAKELTSIVSATAAKQCAGASAAAVLHDRHDQCTAAKFSRKESSPGKGRTVTIGEAGPGFAKITVVGTQREIAAIEKNARAVLDKTKTEPTKAKPNIAPTNGDSGALAR